MLVKNKVNYSHGGKTFIGYAVHDDAIKTKKPLVLVVHDWSGRNEFADKKAESLAELGYTAFAVDMYGDGKVATANEDKMALIKPLFDDRDELRVRLDAALKAALKLEHVDKNKVAAIGFCFGGLCVLDLARMGAAVKAVVSFHGLLMPGECVDEIKTKVLALHGHDDPMVTPEAVIAFEMEMTRAKADWQVHVYGNTKHAFSNPNANDQTLGTVYNALSAKRAWQSMRNLLDEVFA